MVVEYRVVAQQQLETLEQCVNAYIEEGWTPHGSLCILEGAHTRSIGLRSTTDPSPMYVQAMVRCAPRAAPHAAAIAAGPGTGTP